MGEWMEADMNEPGHEVHDDDEIVADLLNHEEEDEESSDEADSTACVTAGEAFDVHEGAQTIYRERGVHNTGV